MVFSTSSLVLYCIYFVWYPWYMGWICNWSKTKEPFMVYPLFWDTDNLPLYGHEWGMSFQFSVTRWREQASLLRQRHSLAVILTSSILYLHDSTPKHLACMPLVLKTRWSSLWTPFLASFRRPPSHSSPPARPDLVLMEAMQFLTETYIYLVCYWKFDASCVLLSWFKTPTKH